MIEGTPAITITLPIQKPGAPRHLVEDEIRALGNARHVQAGLVHLGSGRLHPFVRYGERARIAVNRHTERLRHAVGGDVTVGRPDPGGGDDIGTPERIECVDDCSLLIADDAHFSEIAANRHQVFRKSMFWSLVRPDRILPPISSGVATPNLPGSGGWKKIFKPPKPERGGGSLML